MKYGESTFDILYLFFAILTGIVILLRRRNRADVLMGTLPVARQQLVFR